MKKIIISIIGFLICVTLFSQTRKPILIVPNATTTFGVSQSIGSIIFNQATNQILEITVAASSTTTLNTATIDTIVSGIPSGWVDDGAVVRLKTSTDAVGIGTSTPAATSVLDITSTTKGFLTPRMTDPQRDAIASPDSGLQVYSLTDNVTQFYNGTAWKKHVFTPSTTLSVIGGVPFVIALGEIHADTNFIWDTINKRLGIGTGIPNATLEVRGTPGASVGGFPSGLVHITNPSTTEFSNSVITFHNLFNGNTQGAYVGHTSSSNNNFGIINRLAGDVSIHTTNLVRLTVEQAGNVVLENQIRIKGGSPGVGKILTSDAVGIATWTTAGTGDVVGPASSTDNALARYNLTTGKLIQNSLGILSDVGALTGLTSLTVDNITANGNLISTSTGDLDFTTGTGGVFKFNDNSILAGLDGSNQLEVGHGGSNGFINNTGAGNIDIRNLGVTNAFFTPVGHLHFNSTVDQKHTLKFITSNNANSTGLAYENSGGNFSHTIYRADIGGNRSDLFFDIGSNADIDLLTNSFRIDGSVANLGNVEFFQNVGIGVAIPNASSILELVSTTKGFLPPRMTTVQVDAITSPANGLIVFDTDLNSLRLRKSSGWQYVSTGIIEGQFSHNISQKPTVTDPINLNFNKNDIPIKGLSHDTIVDNEEFTATIQKTFTYSLAPQWERTTTGGTRTIDFFIQLSTDGGTVFNNVAQSNVKAKAGSNDSNVIPLIASIPMNINDIVRFQMRISATGDGLGTVFTAAETGPPPIPVTPAQILTIASGD